MAVETDESPLSEVDLDRPIALVVGNEHNGIRRLVKESCDFGVTIPMAKEYSLNVAQATSIILYELFKFHNL